MGVNLKSKGAKKLAEHLATTYVPLSSVDDIDRIGDTPRVCAFCEILSPNEVSWDIPDDLDDSKEGETMCSDCRQSFLSYGIEC